MTTSEKIQTLKSFLTSYAYQYGWNNASIKELADEAETVVYLISIANMGIASDIATSVEKYKRISEKQAYCIARAAVDSGKDTRLNYLYQ